MGTFGEYLFGSKPNEEKNYWAVQVIQNGLSLLGKVPVRLMDANKLDREPIDKFGDEFPRIGEHNHVFDLMSSEAVKYFASRGYSPWITRGSSVHPLIRELRRVPHWVAAESYYMRSWLLKALNSSPKHIEGERNSSHIWKPSPYFSEEMKVAAYRIQEGFFQGFLVVGPCFIFEEDRLTGTFVREVVEKFLDDANTALARTASSSGLDKDELLRLGTCRPGIHEGFLETKTGLVGRAFLRLLRMEFDPRLASSLQRSTHSSLALISFLTSREDIRDVLRQIWSRLDSSLLFPLLNYEAPVQLVVEARKEKSDKWPALKLRPEGLDAGVRRVWPAGIPDEGKELEGDDVGRLRDRLETCRRDLYLSYDNYHQGYSSGELRRFQRWLNATYGVVSAPVKEEQPEDELVSKEIDGGTQALGVAVKKGKNSQDPYWRTARQLTDQFAADLTTLLIYDYEREKLTPKKTYFQRDTDHREEWEAALGKMILDAPARGDGARSDFISYRCADQMQPQFCRFWDPISGTGIPEGQPLKNPEGEGFAPRRSAMAVPMMINGRLFGVFEISGFNPHQFRYANLNHAHDIGHVLGVFLYQKRVALLLGKLEQKVLETATPLREKYREICQHMAKVFLANASSLYIPKAADRTIYEQVAWFNRKDLNELAKNEHGPNRVEESQGNSYVAEAVRSGVPFKLVDILVWAKEHPGYIKQEHRKGIIDSGIRWAAAIPVRDPGQNGELLCVLVLYYKSYNEAEDHPLQPKEWRLTIEYFANSVAVLVAAAQSTYKRELQLQEMLGHELRREINLAWEDVHQVQQIVEKAEAFEALRKTDELALVGQISRAYRGLTARKQSLAKFSEMLQVANYRECLESGLDIVLYFARKVHKVDLKAVSKKMDLGSDLKGLYSALSRKMDRNPGFEYEFEDDPNKRALILVNPSIFNEIFTNLLENALKYTVDRGKITIRVIKKDSMWEIQIENPGKALKNRQERRTIFDAGYQGSNVEDSSQEGSGWGLAIVQRLCKELGWDIRLECHQTQGLKQRCGNLEWFRFVLYVPKDICS